LVSILSLRQGKLNPEEWLAVRFTLVFGPVITVNAPDIRPQFVPAAR